MKYSGIGGQAVMEGVMMKSNDHYAVAVRKPDGEIEIKKEKVDGAFGSSTVRKIPIVRGVVAFFESLILGMRTLTYSASFFEDEEEKKPVTEEEKKKQARKEKGEMAGTIMLSVVIAVAVFVMLPYGLSILLEKLTTEHWIIALAEGILRLVIFVAYILAISKMDEINRTFMYHGAEHKCINCIESGLELNVDNVRKSSRKHKRCGTSFLLYVLVLTILLFMFIDVDNRLLQMGLRLLLIPVIAGISYEFIRLAGRNDNWFINVLSQPGLLLQRLTTKEPDDAMIEVGIASVEAVFDWKAYVAENFSVSAVSSDDN